MKQYSPGRWLGAYYTQLQYTASYMTFVNFALIGSVVWKTYESSLNRLFPWLTFPIFAGLSIIALFAVIPYLDYVFMLRSRVIYSNEQACKHESPIMKDLAEIKRNLKKHMGSEYEEVRK